MRKSQIKLPADVRTEVFSRTSSSIPAEYQIQVSTENGEAVSGLLEVQGSQWIFPKPVVTTKLEADNTVKAGYWDTFFKVYITPEIDCVATVPKRFGTSVKWLLLIALGVLILAVAVVLFLR